MAWDSVLLGAVCGGLAGGLSGLVFWKRNVPKLIPVAVTVALFMAFSWAGRNYIPAFAATPSQAAKADSKYGSLPVYRTIKQHDPATYKELIAAMVDIEAKGLEFTQSVDAVRAKIADIVGEKLPKSSDDAIIATVETTVDEMKELQQHGKDFCFKFLFPQAGGVGDIRKLVSQQVRDREVAAMELVISTYDSNTTVPTAAQVYDALEPIHAALANKYGSDLTMIEEPFGNDVDRDKVCNIAQDLYGRILKLDRPQAVKVLRQIFSQ